VDVLLMMREDRLHMLEPVLVNVVVLIVSANAVMEEVVFLLHVDLPVTDLGWRCGRSVGHGIVILLCEVDKSRRWAGCSTPCSTP